MSCQGRGIKMLAEWQCTGCFGKKVVSTPYSTTMHLEPGFIFQTPEKSLGYEGHYVQPLNSNMELMVQFVMPGKPEIGFGLPALTQKERIDEGNWENGGVYLPKFRFADSLSLSFRKVISLSDYMGGVDFVFRHLDGEQVRIQYVASSFDLERDRFLLVPDLGFPLPTLGKQGCLVIELLVKMPTVENVSFNATEMKISLESMIIPYVLKYATKSVQVVVAAESKLMQEEAHASRSSNEEAEGVNGCRQM
jgi:DnaJ-class molecular chaperone